MVRLEVLSPVAETDIPNRGGLAPRPTNLAGKTIGLIWNGGANGDIALRSLGELIHEREKTNAVHFYSGSRPLHKPLLEKAQSECDVFIGLTADCGDCAAWLAHDMALLEQVAKPAVMLVSRGFETLVDFKAQTLGLKVPLQYVVVPHSYKSLTSEQSLEQTLPALDDIVRLLTTTESRSEQRPQMGKQENFVFEGSDTFESYRKFNEHFLEKDWGDGYPLWPPTVKEVRELLRGTTLKASDVICTFPPANGIATVEKVAINAVMAGCRPEHLPIVIAGLEAFLKMTPSWLQGHLTSTSAHAPLFVINGPIVKEVGINGEQCCLGPGPHNSANIAIGRALSLAVRNIGHLYPGKLDMDTIGSPRKFNFCMAENEAASPWIPFHVEHGYATNKSTISVFSTLGDRDVSIQGYTSAENLLRMISLYIEAGNGERFLGLRGEGVRPEKGRLLLLPPAYAHALADGGFSKSAVKEFLYHTNTQPANKLLQVVRKLEEKILPEWRWLAQMQESEAERVLLSVVEAPELYHIVVAGSGRPKPLICPLFALPGTAEITARA